MAEAVRMEEALRIMLKDADQRMGCVSLDLTQTPNLNPKNRFMLKDSDQHMGRVSLDIKSKPYTQTKSKP
jgi:hypothetical protein